MFSQSTPKKILITGATGFLGSNLLNELSKKDNYEVVTTNSTAHDLTNIDECIAVTKNIDTVIHLAGLILSRAEQQKRPAETFRLNTLFALNIAEASAKNGVRRIIFANSVTAYPNTEKQRLAETDLWSGPVIDGNYAYGTAKRIGETIARSYHEQYAIEITNIFLPNLYGPGDKFTYNPPPLVPNTILEIQKAKQQDRDTLLGGSNGNVELDLLYANDAARAVVQILDLKDSPPLLNISSGTTISIKDIYATIAAALEYDGSIIWKQGSPPTSRIMDTSAMKKLLPDFTFTTFSAGITNTINNFLKK